MFFGCSPSAGVKSCDIYGCNTSLDATFTDPTDESPFDPIVHPNDPLSTLVTCIDDSCNYYEEYGPSNIKITPAHKNDLTYYKLETQCEENFYCDTLECVGGVANDRSDINLRCIEENVSNGNPLIINVTEQTTNLLNTKTFRCTPAPTITDGDPLCEYNLVDDLVYSDFSGFCENAGETPCDWSALDSLNNPTSDLVYGCNNITKTKNDTWGNYNAECVDSLPSQPLELQDVVYGKACCLSFNMNNFDVYDDGLSSNNIVNGIRIY